jgi:hypothetical protein
MRLSQLGWMSMVKRWPTRAWGSQPSTRCQGANFRAVLTELSINGRGILPRAEANPVH